MHKGQGQSNISMWTVSISSTK